MDIHKKTAPSAQKNPKKADEPSRLSMRFRAGLPVLILFVVLAASLVGFITTSLSIADLENRTVDRIIGGYQNEMAQTFGAYQTLQLGSVGRIETALTAPLPVNVWNRYIAVYDPVKNYPSLRLMLVSFGKLPNNNTVSFVEPSNETTAGTIGKNILSLGVSETDVTQSATLDKTIVGSLPTAQLTNRSVNSGFYIITAMYDRPTLQGGSVNKDKKLRGFSLSFIDSNSLFEKIFSQEKLDTARIRIYVGNIKDNKLLYESDGLNNKKMLTTSVVRSVPFYDKNLAISYEFDKDQLLPWYTTYFPPLLLAGGLIIGTSLAILSGNMIRRRYEALKYEKELDVALAKDELLSLASHQLRTPATGVKQYIGMVLQGFAGKISIRQREYLQRAYESNDRQLHVINDILHLAKIGSGRLVLAEHQFDISRMVREVVEEHRKEAEKAQVKMSLVAPKKGSILGDRHMLRMAVENLLSNAIKYTSPGGSIQITVVERPEKWLISILDTGVGIAKADFPKLFEQFSRIKNPRTDYVTGTGVGLFLAKHLTEMHGGSIIVKSKQGVGSRFTMNLPKRYKK